MQSPVRSIATARGDWPLAVHAHSGKRYLITFFAGARYGAKRPQRSQQGLARLAHTPYRAGDVQRRLKFRVAIRDRIADPPSPMQFALHTYDIADERLRQKRASTGSSSTMAYRRQRDADNAMRLNPNPSKYSVKTPHCQGIRFGRTQSPSDSRHVFEVASLLRVDPARISSYIPHRHFRRTATCCVRRVADGTEPDERPEPCTLGL